MFLFTTPQRPIQAGETGLAASLKAAASATGTSFDYLLKTAKRESNLNPSAKAPNSSATGLFQFIEQTWLGLMKSEGETLGLGPVAQAIQRDGGRYYVADSAFRAQILGLREDPVIAARLAGVFTQKNRAFLRSEIGREPSEGELYIAHFLGAQGASDFISAAQAAPEATAAGRFSDAAASNRSIFYDGRGRARSMREVYAQLVGMHEGAAPALPQGVAAQTATLGTQGPLALSNRAFHSLYSSAGTGEGAQAVRRTWAHVAEQRRLGPRVSFFPRDIDSEPVPAGPSADLASTAPVIEVAEPAYADVPLPPPRPSPIAVPSTRKG